jgi:hypothetical protein
MSKSKRFMKIMGETTARWAETITSTAEPDVAGATKLLKAAHGSDTKIFTVKSPLEFYFAQAVIRGRVSKKAAVEAVKQLGLDPEFIKPLTRFGSPLPVFQRAGRWLEKSAATNPMLCTIRAHIINTATDLVTEKIAAVRDVGSARALVTAGSRGGIFNAIALQKLDALYTQLMPRPIDPATRRLEHDVQIRDWRINFINSQSHVEHACSTLFDAVSGNMSDILAGYHSPQHHMFDAVETEMVCKALNCKDPATIWHYDIFHHVPGYMQFRGAYLLLAGKPKLHRNADNQLHNDAGPAVEWPDGKKFWFIDEHILAQYGEEIVMRPESLTKEMINNIQNEEERRVAIDRMGWNKYLTVIEAKIADNRENWVDNTYEVLIDPPVQPPLATGWNSREEPLRMVLSCRSTGRKYFIAVPRQLAHPDIASVRFVSSEDRKLYPPTAVKTCEQAQKWLADGATTKHLDYAKYPINIVGAS